MTQFSPFDPNITISAGIIRHGLLMPMFTMTDGANSYGELRYTGNWRRVGLVETEGQAWTIKFGKAFSRDLLISNSATGENVAVVKTTLWRGRISVEFSDGQNFVFMRDGLFSQKLYWHSEQYGRLLTVKSRLFAYRKPFEVSFEPGIYKNNSYLLLLSFLSVHLILIRKAAAAAAVH